VLSLFHESVPKRHVQEVAGKTLEHNVVCDVNVSLQPLECEERDVDTLVTSDVDYNTHMILPKVVNHE